jgi:hypothetical protein
MNASLLIMRNAPYNCEGVVIGICDAIKYPAIARPIPGTAVMLFPIGWLTKLRCVWEGEVLVAIRVSAIIHH